MAITRQAAEDRYGGPANLAAILDVKPQTVYSWPMLEPIPATHQKTLAGWIDRDYWLSTYRQIADAFPPFAGERDKRFLKRDHEFTEA